jgi:hypothetical protein
VFLEGRTGSSLADGTGYDLRVGFFPSGGFWQSGLIIGLMENLSQRTEYQIAHSSINFLLVR